MENEGIPACQLPPGRDTRSVNLAHGINHQRFFSVSVPNVKCEAHCELQPLHLSISPSPGQFRKFQIYHITLPPPKKKSQFHHNETMGNSFKWKKKSISPRFLCRKKKLDAISSSQLPSPDPLPTFAPTFCWGTSGPSAEADPVAAFQAANGRPAQGTRDLITGIFCWNPKKWWNLWPGPKKNGNFVYVNY